MGGGAGGGDHLGCGRAVRLMQEGCAQGSAGPGPAGAVGHPGDGGQARGGSGTGRQHRLQRPKEQTACEPLPHSRRHAEGSSYLLSFDPAGPASPVLVSSLGEGDGSPVCPRSPAHKWQSWAQAQAGGFSLHKMGWRELGLGPSWKSESLRPHAQAQQPPAPACLDKGESPGPILLQPVSGRGRGPGNHGNTDLCPDFPGGSGAGLDGRAASLGEPAKCQPLINLSARGPEAPALASPSPLSRT